MARRLDNDEDDMSAIERLEATRTMRSTRAKSLDQPAVERIVRWRANAPWLAGDAIVSFAQAGVEPDDDTGSAVVRRSAKKKMKSRGIGLHMVGDVVSAAQRRGMDVAGDIATAAGTGLRGAVRGATTVVAAPWEGLQAGFRERAQGVEDRGFRDLLWYSPDDDSPRADFVGETTLGQAATQLVETGSADLGRGFLPGGSAWSEQAEAARAAMPTINGSAVTPGRFFANKVVEPGTKPYTVLSGLIDATGAIALDPTAVGLRTASTAAKSRKLFVAGGVDGTRATTRPKVVASWKESKDGRRVREWLAETDDFDTIWKTTNQQIPVRTVAELRGAKTVPEVDAILDDVLGLTVREKPTVGFGKVGGLRGEIRRRTDTIRLAQTMPGTKINIDDIDDAVAQLDLVQKNFKLPRDVISANNAKLAEATSPQAMYDVIINDVLGGARGQLIANGVDPAIARQVTTAWSNKHADYAKYFVDEIGNNAVTPGVVLDGAGKPLPSPHLYSEYLNSAVPMPDAREVRRATSALGRLTGKADLSPRLPVATADWFMQQAWKPMTLLRGAWTTRVVGEEQIRMGAAGLTSTFNHPMSHIAALLARKADQGRATGITNDVLRESIEGKAALTSGSAGWLKRDATTLSIRDKVLYEKGDRHFNQSWTDELAQLHADPIAKRLAGGLGEGDRLPGGITGNNLTDVQTWFRAGAGRKFRNDLAIDDARFADDVFADQYIDSVLERIRIKTGDDTDLMDAVATGKLGDAAFGDKRFVRKLDAYQDVAPVKVKGDRILDVKGKPGAQVSASIDHATEVLFNGLMSRPSNYLSRSPAFEQFYWRRAGELIPDMTAKAQEQVLAVARKNKVPQSILDDLQTRKGIGVGNLSVADADVIAKGYGLDETRKLLYDLSRRSQFFDITRDIFPFGEAWKELLTTWARLGVEQPHVARRAQQIVTGARGSGFFYENENGEETFAYPGSAWLSDKLIGVPVPLTGRVAGLSLMTEILPGVGPVVQIPAAAIIPETPEWDDLREVLFPFGQSEGEEGFVESYLPAWLQKLRASGYFADVPGMSPSPEQGRLLANTATDIMRYQITSGSVARPETPEALAELYEDSMERARVLYLYRGAAAFGAPTAPAPEAVAADKDGRVMAAQVMINRLYELQQEDYETSFDTFLEEFGADAFILAQPKSSSLIYGAPVTSDGVKWARSHPSVVKSFENTYGLFAPTTGDFDYTAYSRQFRTHERQAISPKVALMLANNRVAAHLYDKAKAEVAASPSAEERKWLRDYRAALVAEFPGYGDQPGLPKKAELPTVIAELGRAAKNPTLRKTDAGIALREYLAARQDAQADAEAAGFASFTSAKAMLPTRDWLRDLGSALVAEHPDFAPMWEQVFARELPDDDPAEEPDNG